MISRSIELRVTLVRWGFGGGVGHSKEIVSSTFFWWIRLISERNLNDGFFIDIDET